MFTRRERITVNIAIVLAAILTLATTCLSVSAQTAVLDSLVIEAYGRPATIDIQGPREVYVPDTVTYSYVVRDAAGDTTPALVDISVRVSDGANSAPMQIIDRSGGTFTVVITGTGRLVIDFSLIQLDSIQVAHIDPENGLTFGPVSFIDGAEKQLCAVGYYDVEPFATNRECLDVVNAWKDTLEPIDVIPSSVRAAYVRGDNWTMYNRGS